MVTLDELKDKLASNARLIGLDLGTKRIGIAICDDKRKIASPYKTIEYKNMDYLVKELKNIIKDNNIFAAIIGIILIYPTFQEFTINILKKISGKKIIIVLVLR